ncbi:MAG: hypothetical protein JWO46_825, partial [Nocardioidaceae bacterium]|nr:hypothetical protein [Nocardioidaceae bacterium]
MSGPFAAPTEDAGALAGAATTLGRVSGDLGRDRRAATTAVTTAVADWTGPRSDAFDRAAGGVQVQLRVAEDGCADVATVLHEYSHAVATARHEIADLHRRWSSAQADLDAADPAAPGSADARSATLRQQHGLAEQAAQLRADLATRAAAFAARIDAVTSRVAPVSTTLTPDQIRRQVSQALGAASLPAHPSIMDALAALVSARRAITAAALQDDDTVSWSALDRLPAVPAAGTDPTAVHSWWTSLSPTQQDALLRLRGKQVGNLDGVPVVDRDAANRLRLPVELASLTADLAALGEPPPKTVTGPRGWAMHNPAYDEWKDKHDDLVQRIKGTQSIEKRLLGDVSPPYLLIGFQPREGNGRAIVSQGNPDTATNTSAFVSGTFTRLGGIDGDIERSRQMRRSALRAGADPATLANVTWYGYDAPQSIVPEAASLSFAKDGAPILDRFMTGLRATHDGASPSHTTVVAHSYGTTLTGYAASHGHVLDTDDVVMVASPGVAVGSGWLGTGSVDDLHLSGPSEDHVYATRSRSDSIKYAVGTHLGGDPTDPDFGSHVFGADPGGGHSDYWDTPTNPSLVGMGQAIAGDGDAIKAPTSDETVGGNPITSLL